MDTLTLSATTATRILVFLIYFPLSPLLYRRLARPLPREFRLLAGVMLAAQILVAVMGLLYSPASGRDRWLWHLVPEWNIPSLFASAQLALIAAIALLIGWLAKARPTWYRLYFSLVALVFVFASLDEFFALKDVAGATWYLPYLLAACLISIATIFCVKAFPKRSRRWPLYFLLGLAIIGFGAVLVDIKGENCIRLDLAIQIEVCLRRTFLEEILEVFGAWVAMVALLGQLSDDAAPSRRIGRLLFLLPPLWALLMLVSPAIKPIENQVRAAGATVEFETGARLYAYKTVRHDQQITIDLYLHVPYAEFDRTGYSITLSDQVSGASVASLDHFVNDNRYFYMAPGYVPVFRQRSMLSVPVDAPRNRALAIVFSLWRDTGGEFPAQVISSSDHPLLSGSQVVLGELALPAQAQPESASREALARFANGFSLAPVSLPTSARAGEVLTINFTWRAEADDSADYAQFLHIGNEATGEWRAFDQQPLGARLPTRLWYNGLADSESWEIALPADLAPGDYSFFTGLYRLGDNMRLPVADAEGRLYADARVPLGGLRITGGG